MSCRYTPPGSRRLPSMASCCCADLPPYDSLLCEMIYARGALSDRAAAANFRISPRTGPQYG